MHGVCVCMHGGRGPWPDLAGRCDFTIVGTGGLIIVVLCAWFIGPLSPTLLL
jgi:hypothetical protein